MRHRYKPYPDWAQPWSGRNRLVLEPGDAYNPHEIARVVELQVVDSDPLERESAGDWAVVEAD
jgi:hypothetical protein